MHTLDEQLRRVRRIHREAILTWEAEIPFVDRWFEGPPPRSDSARPIVLDAGCGFQYGLITHYRGRLRVVGLDVDIRVIRRNRDIDLGVQGSAERLPVATESVDLIFCRDVLEHLADPQAALTEFARVLRPGGLVLITTVNTWNPGIWAIRLVPRWLRHLVRRASFGEELGENAPTFHRCNTPVKLRRALRETTGLQLAGESYWPTFLWYFMALTPALLAFAALNRVLETCGLQHLFGGMTFAAEKPR